MKQGTLIPFDEPIEPKAITREEILAKIEKYLEASRPDDSTAHQAGSNIIDCSDKNIFLPYPPNSLLSLTLNRSSQQTTNKYDTTLSEYIKTIKQQMRGGFFRMSPYPCNVSNNKKFLLQIGENSKLEAVKETFVKCNSWTCPRCAPIKARAISYQIRDVVLLNNLNCYLTLTLDPNKLSQEDIIESQTHKIITGFFNHLITTVKRKKFNYFNVKKNQHYQFALKNSGEKLKYVWVIEFQQNGLAHMHILLNQFLPIEVIREVWVHIGGGHIMYIDKVGNLNAVSNYITKYFCKEFNPKTERRLTFRFFEKRYSISQSCERPPKVTQKMFDKDTDNSEILIKLKEMGLSFLRDKLDQPPQNL